eukprot:Em0016g685a
MASNGVPGSRLKPPRNAVSSATGFPTIHAVVAKPGSKLPFKNELMLVLRGKRLVSKTSPDANPLEPHGQKWEVLDGGIPVCQRAAAGLGMNDLRIKWSNQPHSSVSGISQSMSSCNVGVLLITALVNPGNIKNLWNTQESRLVPPFRTKERFGLERDRFLDWKAHLQLAVPRSREDAQKDPWYLVKAVMDAFNECREINLVPGSENVIDESMGKVIPFFDYTPEGIPNLTKIIRKPEGVGVEYKVLADAFTGFMLHIEIQESKEDMANKDFTDRFSKHTALVLRLTKMLHVDDHQKKHWRLNPDTGLSENITCPHDGFLEKEDDPPL